MCCGSLASPSPNRPRTRCRAVPVASMHLSATKPNDVPWEGAPGCGHTPATNTVGAFAADPSPATRIRGATASPARSTRHLCPLSTPPNPRSTPLGEVPPRAPRNAPGAVLRGNPRHVACPAIAGQTAKLRNDACRLFTPLNKGENSHARSAPPAQRRHRLDVEPQLRGAATVIRVSEAVVSQRCRKPPHRSSSR